MARSPAKKRVADDTDDPVARARETLQHPTVRRIVGTLSFVTAILLVLAALGMAGVAGEKLYAGVYYLFGVGYLALPLLIGAWGLSLFTTVPDDVAPRHVRTAGALLLFLSLLGVASVLAPEYAGLFGRLIAHPLVAYLDTLASLVILVGCLVIALLLVFDASLWVSLFTRLMPRKSDDHGDVPLPTEEVVDGVENDAEPEAPGALPPMPTPPATRSTRQPAAAEETGTLDNFLEEEGKRDTSHPPQPVELPSEYTPPPLSLLESDRGKPNVGDTKARANLIRRTLLHFKIPVEMDEIIVGPTVTRYSLKPAEGVKLSKIVALQSNLELALAASPIRIEAPIPGKSLVGIEVPNTGKAIVGLGGLLSSPEFTDSHVPLFVTLGKDIAGKAHYANIGKMPHLLVAGTTGSGKSVMIHSLIASLLYRNGPERLRFIMVDPKRVELTLYNSIPHLLTPVITDAKKCILALKWAAKEMDRRYNVLQEHAVQDIGGYHAEVVAPALAAYEKRKQKDADAATLPELLPHIVVFIDELADIMTAYPRELEAVIVRLAQMSRAVGIHLVLSTQRPSVNVITGLIKANIPTRIALKVASLIDSRTILDQPGAEKLLGAGDMLYLSGDMAKPRRIQSPFLTTAEVKKVAAFLAKHNNYVLGTPIDFSSAEASATTTGSAPSSISFDDVGDDDDTDGLYEEVREFVMKERKASTSLIQRRFKVGYGRAARIMDQLEERGIIAGSDGTNRPRGVLNDAPETSGSE